MCWRLLITLEVIGLCERLLMGSEFAKPQRFH